MEIETDDLNFIDFWESSVIDLILQHLSAEEVLSATQVHRSWNEFMSNESLVCWKDICIRPKVSKDLYYLVDSERRFQHLKAVNISSIVPEFMKIIKKPTRRWKSIVIYRTVFKEKSLVAAVLESSCKTIEKLDLISITYETKETRDDHSPLPTTSFDFPHMKRLIISCHLQEDSEWLTAMLKNVPQLEFLYLEHASDTRMKELILSSVHLKKLALAGKFTDQSFFKDLSQKLPSRLEDFIFNDILSSSRENENLSYFNDFFKSQSKTLKKFETDALLELDELEAAFAMPNLHTLVIRSFHYHREETLAHIENLRQSEVAESSLRFLSVQTMDQTFIELLAIHARGLVELDVWDLHIDDASNPAWFPKLEKFKSSFVIQALLKTINEKTEDERSRFERLIVDGIRPDPRLLLEEHGQLLMQILNEAQD